MYKVIKVPVTFNGKANNYAIIKPLTEYAVAKMNGKAMDIIAYIPDYYINAKSIATKIANALNVESIDIKLEI